jgi:hypothetical protein
LWWKLELNISLSLRELGSDKTLIGWTRKTVSLEGISCYEEQNVLAYFVMVPFPFFLQRHRRLPSNLHPSLHQENMAGLLEVKLTNMYVPLKAVPSPRDFELWDCEH